MHKPSLLNRNSWEARGEIMIVDVEDNENCCEMVVDIISASASGSVRAVVAGEVVSSRKSTSRGIATVRVAFPKTR